MGGSPLRAPQASRARVYDVGVMHGSALGLAGSCEVEVAFTNFSEPTRV